MICQGVRWVLGNHKRYWRASRLVPAGGVEAGTVTLLPPFSFLLVFLWLNLPGSQRKRESIVIVCTDYLPSAKKKAENGPKGTNKNIQYIMQSVLHRKEHNFIYFTYFCSKRLKLTSACYLIMFSCVDSGFQKQM